MYTKSFPINQRMVEGLMPVLTDAERTTPLRDDRPLMGNPIIFAFKLNRAVIDPYYLKIRAPVGFVFRAECLSDIEWRGFMVFGQELDTVKYTEWDRGVRILSCRGEGPDAIMWLDPGSSDGLQAEFLYPFRNKMEANPEMTPPENNWQIDYAGESCNPFIGFPLWTFSRLSMKAVSTAIGNPLTNAEKMHVPVTITFRPSNTKLSSQGRAFFRRSLRDYRWLC
jgi:hypothetical protein